MAKTYNAYLDGVLVASNLPAPDYKYVNLNENVLYRVQFTQVDGVRESEKSEILDVTTLRLPVTITYNLASGTGTFPVQNSRRGSIVKLHASSPTRSGFVFINWKGSDGINYSPGQSVVMVDSLTLTAQWVALRTISFDLDGGTGSFSSQTLPQGSTYTLPSNKPTKTQHAFSHWVYNSTNYAPGAKITVGGSNITFKAVYIFTTPSYTLTYNLNGGSGSFSNQTALSGTDIQVSWTIPTRSGYRFRAWDSSVGSIGYAPGAWLQLTSNITLTANWIQQATLSYNLNGGSGSFGSTTVDINTSLKISTGTPTRSGYRFDGWKDGSTNVAVGATITMSGNKTLVAQWTQMFSFTYAMNGGSPQIPSSTHPVNTTVYFDTSTTITKSGQRFNWWTYNGSRVGEWGYTDANKTLTAQYKTIAVSNSADVTAYTNANTPFRLTVTRTGVTGAPNNMKSQFSVVLTIHRTDSWNGTAFYSYGGKYSLYINNTIHSTQTKDVNFVASSSVRKLEIARWTVEANHGARAGEITRAFKMVYTPPSGSAHTTKEVTVTLSNI